MAYEMGHGGEDLPVMVRDMHNRFWICLIFTIPILVYAPMGSLFNTPAPPFGRKLNLWLFFLASAAILYPGWTFFVSAWRALRTRTLNMAVLVVLSVGTGYLFSVGSTFFEPFAIESTEESRRLYRQMFFTTPGWGESNQWRDPVR